jgi:hypothetical protein
VTGRIERGIVKVGDEIEIVGIRDTQKTTCTGVEMFRKLLDQGQAGDNVGALLRGVGRKDVERGQVLCKPGSITPHTKFKGEGLRPDEGRGRPSHAVLQQLPSAVLLPHDRRDGHVKLPEGTEMVMPGDNIEMKVELIVPIAMEEGCASPSAKAAAPSAPASSRWLSWLVLSIRAMPAALSVRPARAAAARAGPATGSMRPENVRASRRSSVSAATRRRSDAPLKMPLEPASTGTVPLARTPMCRVEVRRGRR